MCLSPWPGMGSQRTPITAFSWRHSIMISCLQADSSHIEYRLLSKVCLSLKSSHTPDSHLPSSFLLVLFVDFQEWQMSYEFVASSPCICNPILLLTFFSFFVKTVTSPESHNLATELSTFSSSVTSLVLKVVSETQAMLFVLDSRSLLC